MGILISLLFPLFTPKDSENSIPVPSQKFTERVEIFPVKNPHSLLIGRGLEQQVVVGTVESFQVKLPAFGELKINVEVAHQVVGALVLNELVSSPAQVGIDPQSVVQDLGAEGQFHFIAGNFIARTVIHSKVKVLADLA